MKVKKNRYIFSNKIHFNTYKIWYHKIFQSSHTFVNTHYTKVDLDRRNWECYCAWHKKKLHENSWKMEHRPELGSWLGWWSFSKKTLGNIATPFQLSSQSPLFLLSLWLVQKFLCRTSTDFISALLFAASRLSEWRMMILQIS